MHRLPAILVILFNIPYLYLTVTVLGSASNSEAGFGYVLIPFFGVAHLFLIPAFMQLFRKGNRTFLTLLNILGLVWMIGYAVMFIL